MVMGFYCAVMGNAKRESVMKKDNDALKKAVCRLLIVLAMSGTVLASSSTLLVYAQESIPPVLSVPEVSTPGEVQLYTQQSNFEYEKYVDPLGNWEIRLTKYLGEKTDGTTVVIPHTIEGLPVEETDANLLAGIPNVIVEFEQGTTKIPDLVCYQKDNVAKLVIPDTVTEIGYYTFEGCQNLREIVWGGRQVLENGKLTIPSDLSLNFADNHEALRRSDKRREILRLVLRGFRALFRFTQDKRRLRSAGLEVFQHGFRVIRPRAAENAGTSIL